MAAVAVSSSIVPLQGWLVAAAPRSGRADYRLCADGKIKRLVR